MGDISYRPLIEDMVWSYSRIQCFHDCPYKWYMQYICHIQQQPRFYASYGSFIHKLLEGYYRGELKKNELSSEFLLGFSDNVRGERPQESTVQKYIHQGVRYLRDLEPLPYKPAAIEKKMVFSLAGIPFVGYIDYLGEGKDGLYVVDHKSRDLKPRSTRKKPTKKDEELDLMLRQLYLYGGAVAQAYGEYPKANCFNCFKEGMLIEEPFREEAYREAVRWAENSVEEIKNAESFPPNMEYFRCRWLCGVSDECCYWKER